VTKKHILAIAEILRRNRPSQAFPLTDAVLNWRSLARSIRAVVEVSCKRGEFDVERWEKIIYSRSEYGGEYVAADVQVWLDDVRSVERANQSASQTVDPVSR
jgi:hypothetical protein